MFVVLSEGNQGYYTVEEFAGKDDAEARLRELSGNGSEVRVYRAVRLQLEVRIGRAEG